MGLATASLAQPCLAQTSLAQATPAGAVDSTAQAAPAGFLQPGRRLVDPSGTVLGDVQHVLTGQDGGVRQVLVRTGGVARVRSSLKALPAAGLRAKGDVAVAALTREELQSLPDVDAPNAATRAP